MIPTYGYVGKCPFSKKMVIIYVSLYRQAYIQTDRCGNMVNVCVCRKRVRTNVATC